MATAPTPPECPLRVARGVPVDTSHNRTTGSLAHEANQAPSGEMANPRRLAAWPDKVTRGLAVPTSQIRAVWSLLALASQVPSGAIATAVTRSVWALTIDAPAAE